jgi:hypothetical protein
MFDMHGQEDCWLGDRNCGVAGEYMDIRYNTFLYEAGPASGCEARLGNGPT